MAKQKRTYPMEFKQEALHLLATSGKGVRQVEEDLGITPGLLRKWKVRYQLDAATGDVKPSEQRDLEVENRRLRHLLPAWCLRSSRLLPVQRPATTGAAT